MTVKLSEIDRLAETVHQAAMRGPVPRWKSRRIATAAETMTAALRDVLALHESLPNSRSALFPHPLCTCGKASPCPTVVAIAAHVDPT